VAAQDDIEEHNFESRLVALVRRAREERLVSSAREVDQQLAEALAAESAARRIFGRLSLRWPPDIGFGQRVGDPRTLWDSSVPPGELQAFERERWGEGLLAVTRQRSENGVELLDSPAVRRLLRVLRRGVEMGRRPYFERVADGLARALAPARRKGRRTRLGVDADDWQEWARALYVRCHLIAAWLEDDLPKEQAASPRALIKRLWRRPYAAALTTRNIFPAEIKLEREMLPFVANAVLDYRNSDGGCRLATLCRDAFFRFGEAYGFTRPGETAAGFVRRVKRSGT
jgi:hypothetical protein